MKRRIFLGICAAVVAPGVRAQDAVDAMRFSALKPGAPLPAGWRHFAFERQARQTEYALVEDEGRTVLRARAHASTSGIIRELRVDPRVHPILAWRWKVMRVLDKSDLATKAGDDFPARLYVTFDVALESLSAPERLRIGAARMLYGPDVPVAALCYVWDTKAPAGTLAPSAYTDRVRMIVVDSGFANVGRWVAHRRHVVEDFRRAFGVDAPAINGVIVSTDTDNTAETAEAYYGDVEFRAR
ncbi:MAG TPA: DUF3047 domain-containing protein [Burkholderiales bacterium]|nr:DUF3047 domain-containing protein [Burkholderiales bacterium]